MAVIQEAWIGGVSTRRVDELVQAMGLTGISKSTVSKLCKDIDERVQRLPRAAARRRVALSLARRHLPQGARGRAHRLGRRHNRRGGRHRGPARDRRPAHRPLRGRDLLDRPSCKSLVKRGLQGREAGDLRRARGPQGRHRPRLRRDLAALPRSLDAGTRWPMCPRASTPWSPPRSARPSSSPTRRPPSDLAPRRRPAPRPLAEARRPDGRRARTTCSPT